MRVRDELYKQWLRTRNLNFLSKYKKYRNKITYINKLYRTSYYNDVPTPAIQRKCGITLTLLLIKGVHRLI